MAEILAIAVTAALYVIARAARRKGHPYRHGSGGRTPYPLD